MAKPAEANCTDHQDYLNNSSLFSKGWFEIYRDTSGFNASMVHFERLARYIIVGILLAGIIVGSAIATGIAAAFCIARSD